MRNPSLQRRPAILILVSVLVITGCGPSADRESVVTEAGAFRLEVSLEPDPPKQKGGKLQVAVNDLSGSPIEGAAVDVRYRMPAMGSMPEMRGEAEISAAGGGRYQARMDFPMDGSWDLDVKVAVAGNSAVASYRLTIGSRGLIATGVAGSSPPNTASTAEVDAHVEPAHEGDISHYTCSMHPSVRSQEGGTCPICSMDLVPVTREEVETGVFTVDAQRRQLIGVRTATVERQPVEIRVRAVGKVVYDETRLSDVSVKFRGWIGRLSANSMGQAVSKGETLFTLYSPELFSAQEEYLAALASQRAAAGTSAPARADYLVDAARARLRLWDLPAWRIDQIAQQGSPAKHLPVVSPVSGVIIEKNVVQGAVVEPGMKLYRIAGLETVWVEAEVYESELPLVSVGQEAEVVLPYLPGKRFRGRVSFVYPYLGAQTRTGRVRIELSNPDFELRPDMYADVELEIDLGRRLVVPAEAVLHAGPRRLVFLDLGAGRLKPQEIEIGVRSGDDYEVLAGLEEGDVIVASGNFLIAAESRLKSAVEQW